MEYMTLYNGVRIPLIGLGVWQCGDQTKDVVAKALTLGYRMIDTSAQYENEEEVSKGIKESGLSRDDVFITTKVRNRDIRSGRTKEAFMDSLHRLHTDYIDMYLIEWPAEGFVRAWQDMAELYHEGWVRVIGVSNFQIHHGKELAEVSDVMPAINQIESHPYYSNQELVDYCHKNRMEISAYSPLGSGINHVLEDPALHKLAEKYGKTPAQIILRWDIQRGIAALPKSVHEERLKENLDIFDFKLTTSDMVAINKLNRDEKLPSTASLL
jgi:diketogulonate reductase-like aldo/keto reductase